MTPRVLSVLSAMDVSWGYFEPPDCDDSNINSIMHDCFEVHIMTCLDFLCFVFGQFSSNKKKKSSYKTDAVITHQRLIASKRKYLSIDFFFKDSLLLSKWINKLSKDFISTQHA